jgi:hypothetical protein
VRAPAARNQHSQNFLLILQTPMLAGKMQQINEERHLVLLRRRTRHLSKMQKTRRLRLLLHLFPGRQRVNSPQCRHRLRLSHQIAEQNKPLKLVRRITGQESPNLDHWMSPGRRPTSRLDLVHGDMLTPTLHSYH